MNILVKPVCFGASAEIYRIQGIQRHIVERKLNIALFGKFSEFIRHTEEARAGIEGEPVFLYLVQPSACLAILFNNLYLIPFFCQA